MTTGQDDTARSHDHGAAFGIACIHVLERMRPVNIVAHAPDGTWDFICGEDDDEHEDVDKLHSLCAGCGFEAFVDGLEMDELPVGWTAERPDAGARWVVRPMTQQELQEYEED